MILSERIQREWWFTEYGRLVIESTRNRQGVLMYCFEGKMFDSFKET